MAERRYNQEEVEAIFQRAAEAQQRTPLLRQQDEGMTLAQLQEIGREVGISPEQIGAAAGTIERAGRTTKRSFLGLPIGVGRTVDLGRKLSDAEWDRLVVELRDTFDAKGRIKQEGNFRQWSNGNLQAMLEPVGDAHRLRMRTMKGNAYAYLVGGLSMIGVAGVVAIASATRGAVDVSGSWMTLMLGGGMLAVGAAMLPGWARERRRQMQEIAERVAGWASGPAQDRLR